MTWSYSVTENYVTQTFIVTIDSSATAGADPEQNIVTFISVSRNDGNRLYFRTFEDKTYEMPPEAVSVLTEQIGVIFDDGTVDDDASVTLDLSQTTLTGLLIDLRFLSVHQRQGSNRELRDGVTENSLGSRITTIIGTNQDDFILGSAEAETIEGRDGDDYLTGGGCDDTLKGGDGDDIITPGSGNDHIDGGEGNDVLDAGMHGGNLKAGAGNDTLYGNRHADYFDGGEGNDRFVIDLRTGSDNGTDTIREFAKSGSSADKIVFQTDDADETSLTELGLSLIYENSDTKIVDADDTDSVYAEVQGVDLTDGSSFSSYFEVI